MTRTPEEAIAFTRQGETFPEGTCLRQTRRAYDVDAHDFEPTDGHDPWAIEAWDHAEHKHPTSDPMAIPRGAPVFWRKPGRPGHIAIALGDGAVRTTDFGGAGHWNTARIQEISNGWDMELVGWTEDLNGVRVYTPPAPEKPLPPVETPLLDRLIDEQAAIIADLGHAIGVRNPGPKRAALRAARQKQMEARQQLIAARRIVKGLDS